MDIFNPVKVLEEKDSKFNGKVKVVRSLGLGTYIQVDNLTQSGGVVNNIWKEVIRKVKKIKPEINNCLILGLGGGTIVSLIEKYWKDTKIIGVDIDPVMVEMGEKYLGLKNVKTVIADARKYITKDKQKYDLIIVDLYQGYEYPTEFEKEEYLEKLKNLLSKDGVLIVNRLYFGEKRPMAMKFGIKLEKVFSKVEYLFPEANLFFLCSD
jgi:spermidine synthase